MLTIAQQCPNVHIKILDKDYELIENSQQGIFRFHEPGLDQLFQEVNALVPPRLVFTHDTENSINDAQIIFIAVGIKSKTKPFAKKGRMELDDWESVWRKLNVGTYHTMNKTIVELSTIPLDYKERLGTIVQDVNSFKIAYIPSFISEGTAIHNLLEPYVVVIAASRDETQILLCDIYLHWVPKDKIFVITNFESAILGKLGLNACLATRLTVMNSLNSISNVTGANITEVSSIISQDPRIGNDYLKVGVGFGGSGLEKDLSHLALATEKNGLPDESNLLKHILKVNEAARKHFVEKMQKTFLLKGKRIAILGVTYKKDTDSLSNSPAIGICRDLLNEEGVEVMIYDPKINLDRIRPFLWKNIRKVRVLANAAEACYDADAICILTDWDEFLNLDFIDIYTHMRSRPNYAYMFLGRQIELDLAVLTNIGFKVHSI